MTVATRSPRQSTPTGSPAPVADHAPSEARPSMPVILEAHDLTKTYPLEGVNDGYADMRDGRNLRGVLVYQ